MMKQRKIIKMFLLYIVTLGMYRLYWLYKTRQEMVNNYQQKIPSFWILFGLIITTYLSVILLIGAMIAGGIHDNQRISTCQKETKISEQACRKKIDDEFNKYDTLALASLIIFYVMVLIAGPLTAYWYWKYAKAAEVVTKEKMQFALGMIFLLLVPDGLDILIFQDYYNKINNAKSDLPTNAQNAIV